MFVNLMRSKYSRKIRKHKTLIVGDGPFRVVEVPIDGLVLFNKEMILRS